MPLECRNFMGCGGIKVKKVIKTEAKNTRIYKRRKVMELIELLIKNLGVREDQAEGGAGLLFNLAKEKLGGDDFSQVAQHVPGINELIGSAPKSGGLGAALGGLASSIGGDTSKLGDIASLASGFSELGLDSGMLGKFIPIILSFVQEKGGSGVKDLLEKVLK